ncbi:hypothetical protein KAFR_0A07330 [Kazachstania africana CBS 2517]|uniref:Adenine deaminase n=1 Tax=Kazachstania africana (strain ATCC 22294 / BCRC 22015 / CBS 2517 / CECT 1963 / NBRC 1671 / NRRL Y-8276) TaxID=1071382 RepID=H2AP67_KAZAF|nr:hypothetical protein KAFR_0A07330 [Kazachstania africana CBS 2517]CCF56167.1 hypothetical protein KAFR_0A07330 [Kazachstania africana CBS 2517]
MVVSEEFLRKLPKCEHHLHIEGTLEPDLLFPLAERNGVKLPDTFPQTVQELNEKYKSFADLQDFLNYYYIGTNVLITEEDFFQLTWEYFKKISKQSVVHTEIFYDPQSHTDRGIKLATVTNGIKRACEKAEKEFGITSKIIMCLLRHIEPAKCLETIEEAKDFLVDGTITGLGLDSAEKPFPPHLFVECYERAREINKDLKLTAHAGEEGSAKYVSDSLDLLQTTRVDHGVNSIQDGELMKRLADEQIMLTVCPLSNVKLQVVSDVKELPLQKLIDNNVPFSLNSDDPAYFGGYILDNYLQVAKSFPHWDYNVWSRIAKNAINGSWCDEKRKFELLERVDSVVQEFSK